MKKKETDCLEKWYALDIGQSKTIHVSENEDTG